MSKQINSSLLVAGGTVAAGILALPMTITTLGLMFGTFFILSLWFLMYCASLMSLELSLQKHSLLHTAHSFLSEKMVRLAILICIQTICFLLFSLYFRIYYNEFHSLFSSIYYYDHPAYELCSDMFCMIVIALLLILPLKNLSYINNLLFICLLCSVIVLITALWLHIDINIDFTMIGKSNLSEFHTAIPSIIAFFAFICILDATSEYCDHNPIILQKAFFYGGLISAVLYIFWFCGILGAIYTSDPEFYKPLLAGEVDFDDIKYVMSKTVDFQFVQITVALVKIFATLASMLIIGTTCVKSLSNINLLKVIEKKEYRNLFSAMLFVFSCYLLSSIFFQSLKLLLGIVSILSVIGAIILPAYLLYKTTLSALFYKELKYKWFIEICIIIGLLIMFLELFNFSAS